MTNLRKLRKFNSAGINKVEEILSTKAKFDDSILFDNAYSEHYSDLEIDLDKTFTKKSEISEYFFNTLSSEVSSSNNDDPEFWTWLLCAYFKFYVKHDAQGNPHPINRTAYILTKKGFVSGLSYRHLVFSYYRAYELWGKKSAIFDGVKGTAAHIFPDVAEQFLSRKFLYRYFDIFYDIFFDKANSCLRSGVSTSFRQNKPWASQKLSNSSNYSGYGGFIRWIKKVEQYSRIYRFHGMTMKKIRKVFAPEF
tara:strand:- start:1463 stop:2215 length:753 start_codon:yes stop_codon:yes gene_type:complete